MNQNAKKSSLKQLHPISNSICKFLKTTSRRTTKNNNF